MSGRCARVSSIPMISGRLSTAAAAVRLRTSGRAASAVGRVDLPRVHRTGGNPRWQLHGLWRAALLWLVMAFF